MQTWVVPSCVQSVTLECYGAQGGTGASGGNISTGGAGGLGSKVIAVSNNLTAGSVLNIFVGGAGATPVGGFNGGGNGGSQNAGGGGGATDIRLNAVTAISRILVAAGGGGGGRGGCEGTTPSPFNVMGGTGGSGGANGLIGINAPTPGGLAGAGGGGTITSTSSFGGAAGIGCGGFLGQPGVAGNNVGIGGVGGNGQTCCCVTFQSIPGGGGGGGGFIGGGGGGGGSAGTTGCSGNDKGAGGGGAGGTNTVIGVFTNTAVIPSFQTGNGLVIITYSLASPPTIVLSNSLICDGNTVTITASGATTYTWTNFGNNASINVSPSVTTVYLLNTTLASNSGPCTQSASASVSVNPSPTISIAASTNTICAGSSATILASGASSYTWSNAVLNASFVASPTITTVYTATSTANVNSCTAVKSLTLSVNPKPTIIAVTNSTMICEGESATLTVSGASTYSWNTNTTSSTTIISPSVNTIYTVTGTDINGCSNTSTITQFVTRCLDIKSSNGTEASLQNPYPNPNNGLFTIELKANAQVKITDITGRAVYKEILKAGKHPINIQNQANGSFFLQISQDGNEQTIKIIKE